MVTAQQNAIPTSDPSLWLELYHMLTRYMRRYVYRIHCWRGQEHDMLEDIVQHTIVRVFDYLRTVEQGQAAPIVSLHRFSQTIAQHYYLDQVRKYHHVTRMECDEEGNSPLADLPQSPESGNAIEMLLKELTQASSLNEVVEMLSLLPEKQKEAQLINLAHLFKDDEDILALLEVVLAQVGITLHDYIAHYPLHPRGKNSHASSLSTARKKLRVLAEAYYGSLDIVFV